MAAAETEQKNAKESNGGGSSGGSTAVRAAALAAATGATAYAAKKALSGRDQSSRGGSEGGSRSGGGDDSLFGAMLGSGWGAAKDSLLPFAEDAAESAGEWLGRSGPEIVRETIVPRFIDGFQRGSESSGDS